jgi:spore coat polysaccharide biosynthesis protein SpsF
MSKRGRKRVAAVVQARMTSTRLPGKVLAEIGGDLALRLVLSRLSEAREIDEVVVATSSEESDDPVARVAAATGVTVVRGPLDDVLERYRQAARGDAVVRITADCPLVDPDVVDLVVRVWKTTTVDFAANCLEPRTFPEGLDVEVISRRALDAAAAEAVDGHDREHVTPFLRARPERFKQIGVELQPAFPMLRITLDTLDDLRLLRRLVEQLGADARMHEIVEYLTKRPVKLSCFARTGDRRIRLN